MLIVYFTPFLGLVERIRSFSRSWMHPDKLDTNDCVGSVWAGNDGHPTVVMEHAVLEGGTKYFVVS
jgi:hypothetical protein